MYVPWNEKCNFGFLYYIIHGKFWSNQPDHFTKEDKPLLSEEYAFLIKLTNLHISVLIGHTGQANPHKSLPLISQQSGKFIHHNKGNSKNLFFLGLATLLILSSTLFLLSFSQSSSLLPLQLLIMHQNEIKKIIPNFILMSFFVQTKIETGPQMSVHYLVVFSFYIQQHT